MADDGDGFVGRCEVVEPRRRGKRHWPDEVKARIVAKSLQPGVRVSDVAGLVTIEVGDGVVLRVPGAAAVERVAALVRALRGAS